VKLNKPVNISVPLMSPSTWSSAPVGSISPWSGSPHSTHVCTCFGFWYRHVRHQTTASLRHRSKRLDLFSARGLESAHSLRLSCLFSSRPSVLHSLSLSFPRGRLEIEVWLGPGLVSKKERHWSRLKDRWSPARSVVMMRFKRNHGESSQHTYHLCSLTHRHAHWTLH